MRWPGVFVVDPPCSLVTSAFTPRPILCDNYAVAGHDDSGTKATPPGQPVTVKWSLPGGVILDGRRWWVFH